MSTKFDKFYTIIPNSVIQYWLPKLNDYQFRMLIALYFYDEISEENSQELLGIPQNMFSATYLSLQTIGALVGLDFSIIIDGVKYDFSK